MAGRPKKKPEYNPELQFNNFLQELRDAYEEADSLRSLADELNISLLKLRKLLITADVFTSDICTEINDLHNHMLFISENRYTIGTEGKYKILRNDSEKELISNCVIARLEQIKVEDLGQEYTREEVEYQSDKILKEIKRYLFIIDYELEEINHSRRIEWQDTVIEERKYGLPCTVKVRAIYHLFL